MAAIFPRQKIPTREKTPQWYRGSSDFIRDQANIFSNDRSDIIELYKAAAGDIDIESYKYVTNPFDSADNNLQFPARLRNYDIIIPIISLFLGEKADRPFNHRIIVANPDVTNKHEEQQKQEFIQAMAQDVVNELNNMKVPTGVKSQPVDYDSILKKYEKIGMTDERAIIGQDALDYLKYSLALKDRYLEGLYDWIVTGRVRTYKDVYKNDVIHEIVPVLELWNGPTRSGFIEDAPWVLRRTRTTLNDIVDRFHEAFASKDVYNKDGDKIDALQILEDRYRNTDGDGSSIRGESYSSLDSEIDRGSSHWLKKHHFKHDGPITVEHTVWKGFVKVKTLTYTDQLGMQQEMEVDEDYKFTPEHGDIDIKEEWMNIVHEQFIIDDDLYIYGRECQVQRNELSNTSICKLPYNGRDGYSDRDKINSVVKQILPYAKLTNVLRWRFELVIAKNKEKIMTLPLGLIPDGEGWTEDKVFHFVEAMNILVLDETKPNAIAALNALKSIDMSLGNYVTQLLNAIRNTKEEAWDAIGMNRQRYGDVNSSDGKATNEQALIRSSVISRELNRRYEGFEETDIQGLLECSKLAWIDGKKASYLNSDLKNAMLNIEGWKYLNADMGVFGVDSQEEFAKLKMSKDYVFGAAQKANVSGTIVLETIDANNMSKLKVIVAQIEEAQKEYEQAQEQAKMQNDQALKQMELERQQRDGQIKIEAENIKAEAAIKVALINNSEEKDSGDDNELADKSQADFTDKVRKHVQENTKDGLAYAEKISKQRLDEANLALNQEKLKMMKNRPNK